MVSKYLTIQWKSLIVQVSVFVTRTVYGDIDWNFNNPSGGRDNDEDHHHHDDNDYLSHWVWKCRPEHSSTGLHSFSFSLKLVEDYKNQVDAHQVFKKMNVIYSLVVSDTSPPWMQ